MNMLRIIIRTTQLCAVLVATLAIIGVACGGSDGPTSPSSTATVTNCTDLSGCGTNVKGVFIIARVASAFSYTFAGTTTTGSSNMTRQFVGLSPGEYEIAGQAEGGIGLTFSQSRGFGPDTLQVVEGNVSSRDCIGVTFGNLNPGGAPQAFRIRIRLADRETSACLAPVPTATPAPTPAPTPTPTPTPTGALSGTWTGTVIATIGNNAARPPLDVTFLFDHTSSGLTGIMSASPSRPGLTARFDLTPAFTGNLTIVFEGKTSVQGGSMQVNTSDSTMTGTFAGTNTDGLAERNVFSLRKQ